MQSNLHPCSVSQKKCSQERIIHMHVHRSTKSVFFLYSTKEKVDWESFLSGLVCPAIVRYIELSRDEFGIQRVVRDVHR